MKKTRHNLIQKQNCELSVLLVYMKVPNPDSPTELSGLWFHLSVLIHDFIVSPDSWFVGVGGIEAEAVMLGQSISMVLPQVVGYKLMGEVDQMVTSTDVVLTVTKVS